MVTHTALQVTPPPALANGASPTTTHHQHRHHPRRGLSWRAAVEMVVVRFESVGPLGISWRHRREDGAAIVKTIRPGE